MAVVSSTAPGSAASNMIRRTAWNTLSNYVGKLLSLTIGVVLTPFVLREVGPSNFGLWVLVGSVLGYGALLDLGIGNAITKYVSEYRATGQPERAQQLVATALWLYTALGLMVIVFSALLAPSFPRLFQVPETDAAATVQLVFVVGTGAGLALPCSTAGAVLRGLHRFDLQNAVTIVGVLLGYSTMVVVLLLGGGLLGLALVNIGVMLAMQVPNVWLIRRAAPDLGFGWRGGSLGSARAVLAFSSWLFAINVASQVDTKTDEIVIGASLPVRAVTPYALANRLSDLALILTDQFMKVLLPLAAQLHAGGDRAQLRELYLTSTRLALALFVPIGGTLAVLAGPLLTVWVGPSYAEQAYLVVILVCADAVNASQWPAASILQAMARHRPLAVSAVTAAAANLALSIILLPRLGLAGVALGTLIPTVVGSIGFTLPYSMRVVGVSVAELLREVVTPVLLPALPMAALTAALLWVVRPNSFLALFGVAAAAILVYGGAYLWCGASQLERRAYGSLMNGLLRPIGHRFGQAE